MLRLNFYVVLCGLCLFLSDVHAFQTAQSDANGVTVEFELPELKITPVEYNGVRYQSVGFEGGGFTGEVGNPQAPVARMALGVPPDVDFHVEILSAANETRSGYRLPPVPHSVGRIHQGDGRSEKFHTAAQEWREDGSAYQSSADYPKTLAKVVYDGYLRSQRVVYLELRPVQYNPRSRLLRVHPRMRVRIHFLSRPGGKKGFSSSPSSYGAFIEEPAPFERQFSSFLLNYNDAKKWRVRNPAPSTGPPAAVQQASAKERFKILIDKTGIYRITGIQLRREWGVDLRNVDPRYFHLSTNGQEIPMYVYGEADGRFDDADSIEFYGIDARSRYTRWTAYWLSEERTRGKRAAEFDAAPSDPTAKFVPAFRSKFYFEEDHLHSTLQQVHPEDVSAGDKHGWFKALDLWYWTGINNPSDYNEVDLEFPLYDVAQSFDPPKIRIHLQGGTPAQHEVLVSVNGVRVDVARWLSQNTLTLEKTLRVWNNLRDASKGELNAITLARIDTTTEENTTTYPYHVYINAFEVEYTRLLKAVNDSLFFRSPASADPYPVRQQRNLSYTVEGFISPDVTIYEYDGKILTAKLLNPKVERVNLSYEERERLRAIARFSSDTNLVLSEAEGEDVSLADIPRVAYNATFHAPDSHDSQFIAVSSAGLRRPVKVEAVPPSGLLSTSNGADYVIITHPVYREPSERLARWRSTQQGGGYRAAVVDVTQVYDIFSDGMVDPAAIKAFLKYAYENWTPPALSYVTIMGDGTYDFRGIDEELYPEPPELTGYIPTHYIWTASFGQTSVDHWFTTVNGIDELPDFYIGRLSAESLEQANAIVDKIIAYEGSRPNGSWRRRIISVADDEVTNSGDFIFKKSLTEIAEGHTLLGYETRKIFLEDVIKTVKANPADYPGKLPQRVAKDMVTQALGSGGVIAQYAGHGGRIVWAHEAIFDNASVDLVAPTKHVPFMLVLSCYNGYYDAPGEPSLAEKMLRVKDGGIIAMLSATRLTYGSGNDTLNRIIFDALFKRNEHQLGPISMDSKIEQTLRDGVGQLDVMMEYTLFGDPAMNLAMADYEMLVGIETKTVAPGQTLKTTPGQIAAVAYNPALQRKEFTPLTTFNGKIQAKAVFTGKFKTVALPDGAIEVYTGDVVVTQEGTVVNGGFPGFSFPVPEDISSGNAHVEFYAENATHIAVGGASFTVLIPKILDIQPELVTDTTFRISVQISDEKSDQGIKSVTLDWRNPKTREWTTETMIIDRTLGVGWYTVAKPLPLSANSAAIRYQIRVIDVDNHQVESDLREYRPFIFPDVRVVSKQGSSDALIYYGYALEENAWTINADIEQIEDVELKENLLVAFFEGNPDLDGDGVIDADAKLIGKVEIRPDQWQRRHPIDPGKTVAASSPQPDSLSRPRAFTETPLNISWIATATIRRELPIGNYEIFVCVDPISDANSLPHGALREGDDANNLSSRLIAVESTLLGQADKRVASADAVIDFRMTTRAASQPAIFTVTPLSRAQRPQPEGQPGLISIALPNGDAAAAYNTTLKAVSLSQGGSGVGNTEVVGAESSPPLHTPVTAELRFDLAALKAAVQAELGWGEIIDLLPDQVAAINEGVQQRAKEIGVYLWVETLGKWTRLNSERVAEANGAMRVQTIPTNIRQSNQGNGQIRTVELSPGEARVGKWVLLFTGAGAYRVLVSAADKPLEMIDPNRVVDQFADAPGVFLDGVAIGIESGETPFGFGDVLTFEVSQGAFGAGTSEYFASSFRARNVGSGLPQYIRVADGSAIPAEQWVILFVDSARFQVEGAKTGVLSQNGQPVLGRIGEEFRYDPFGLSVKILPGEASFQAGDSFQFETRAAGIIRAFVPMLGPLALMRSSDAIPPDIKLTIGKQNFVDGDPVSSEPLIQATLTDDNGIDYITRPVRLEISQDSREFRPISEQDYQLNHRAGSNQVTLNYQSPKLEPGTYQVRLTAQDVDGNESTQEIEFRVHQILQLLRAMNYPNPFKKETDITCELTGAAEEMTVKIYSVSGRLVREFTEPAPAGFMMMPWDGRDENGEEVANGVYYCKIRVKSPGRKDLTEYIKMMKLK